MTTKTLEVLEFEIREVTDSGDLRGIAVPFGEVAEGIGERFERGALPDDVTVPFFYGHDHLVRGMPIGTATGKNTDQGYEVVAKFADTAKAQEVRSLAKAGALSKFSIGFEPVESRMDGDVLVRTAANWKELSVVPFPAYDGATVTEVRSETNTPKEDVVPDAPSITEADLTEIRESLSDLERKFVVIGQEQEGAKAPQFRDGGEFLKALARGDEAAKMALRAADQTPPATSAQAGADAQNSWLARPVRLVQENRQIHDLFATGTLPDFGNTVEYPTLGSTSGTVEEQVAEGDALAYMEVELTTGTATVGTYGGYSTLTRQAIERGDTSYLSKVLEYQALQYAKATETVVRNAVTGAIAGANAAVTVADSSVLLDWIDAAVDAAAAIEDNSLGLTADFMLVSRTTYKSIVHAMVTAGWKVSDVIGGGQAGLAKPSLSLGDLPLVVAPRVSGAFARVASKEALTTLESAGAPFRLQDDNIVNLTKDFSLYGYLAVTVNDPKGFVPITITA